MEEERHLLRQRGGVTDSFKGMSGCTPIRLKTGHSDNRK